MSQRRSYNNSGDFNLDDLFRPEPDAAQQAAQQSAPPVQQGFPTGQFQGGPEYAPPAHGVPPQAAAPAAPADASQATQYLPPYPTGQPVGGQPMPGQQTYGGQGFGAPQQFGEPSQHPQQQYGEPQQSYGGQTFGGQQGFPAAAATQQYPAPPSYGAQAPESGRRGVDKRVVIGGGVVAALAVVGIVIALSGGGGEGEGTDKKATTASSSAKPSSGASAGSGAAVSPEVKAQAEALSALLGDANASRTAVVNAVGSVRKCEKLPESQAALDQAAQQRDKLVSGLAALKVDQLPSGAALAEQLKKAWEASANADREYALWAADSIVACDPAKKDNQHLKNGDAASGTATTAKNQASTLWNAIAAQTGLPAKTAIEL
ncbi:hypothetical protein ACIA8O_23545 [Kitasatospora sp. NPDC051853]|uniref:hypothetical protein n=1 Tax=Kitasatospora sp. NPDC051853 TaxID=3364058 RepID=UPI0037A5C016